MNQVQRKFLIDKIEKTVDSKIAALKKEKPDYPSVLNHLYYAIMQGTLEVQPPEKIKEAIKQRALKSKAGENNWLHIEGRTSWGDKEIVEFKLDEVFVLPEEYRERVREYREAYSGIDEQIMQLTSQRDMLVLRIQLASDKTLEKMISEVDDMGDLSLMDTKIKLLK